MSEVIDAPEVSSQDTAVATLPPKETALAVFSAQDGLEPYLQQIKAEIDAFVRVVFYNRLAEIAGEYLKKGRPVYVEGRLKTRKWQDKDTGADRFSTEIVADQMQMLGGRDDDEGGQQRPHQRANQPAPQQRPTTRPSAPQAPAASLADMDDDIPF